MGKGENAGNYHLFSPIPTMFTTLLETNFDF